MWTLFEPYRLDKANLISSLSATRLPSARDGIVCVCVCGWVCVLVVAFYINFRINLTVTC